jgi:hypothetical protein
VLGDKLFLEDALEMGDVRAVVLVIRALRGAYKLHGISFAKAQAKTNPSAAARGATAPVGLAPVHGPHPGGAAGLHIEH